MGILVLAVEVDARDGKQEQRSYGHGYSVGLGLVFVHEHHVEHANDGKEVFAPILVIAVVARAHGGDDRREEQRQKACAHRQEEAQLEQPLGFAHHHECGCDQRPLADLQRQKAHHGLVRVRSGSYVDKAPEVGHLADYHYEAVDEPCGLLMLPGSEVVLVFVDEQYGRNGKDHGCEVGKRPLPEVPKLPVSEESLTEVYDFPYLAFHMFSSMRMPCLMLTVQQVCVKFRT